MRNKRVVKVYLSSDNCRTKLTHRSICQQLWRANILGHLRGWEWLSSPLKHTLAKIYLMFWPLDDNSGLQQDKTRLQKTVLDWKQPSVTQSWRAVIIIVWILAPYFLVDFSPFFRCRKETAFFVVVEERKSTR